MKKKSNIVISIVLAFTLAIGMAIGAFAEDGLRQITAILDSNIKIK